MLSFNKQKYDLINLECQTRIKYNIHDMKVAIGLILNGFELYNFYSNKECSPEEIEYVNAIESGKSVIHRGIDRLNKTCCTSFIFEDFVD